MTAACHEGDMVLLCARSALSPTDAQRLRTLAAGSIDWELLFLLARKHRVLPLLERHLEAACLEKAPRAWIERLRSRTADNARRNGQLAAETGRVLALAERSGIVAVAFKGPLLAATAYGDLTLRQVWDIDVLVEERQSESFVVILAAEGYVPKRRFDRAQDLLHLETGIGIDLHWGLTPAFFPVDVGVGDLLSRRRQIIVGDAPCMVPDDADMLFILCLQLAKDCWERRQHLEYLSKAVDIAEFLRSVPPLDWERIRADAQRQGWLRVLRFGLGLAAGLLDAPLPPSLRDDLRRDPTAARLVADVCRRLFAAEDRTPFRLADAPFTLHHRYRQLRFYMAMRERPSDWLRHLAEIGRSGMPRMASAWLGRRHGGGFCGKRSDGRAVA